MRPIIATLFLISIAHFVSAQVSIVNKDLEPISDAQVFTKKSFLGITDDNGYIKLDNDISPLDTISLYHQQYHTKRYAVGEIKELQVIILTRKTNTIGEIVITPPRTSRLKMDLATSINLVTKKQIDLFTPQTSADLLNLGNTVYIQKSQQGGGSPMIRGFATSRILLVVDGVRMNTAIFRGGNVQNVLSIDPLSIESSKVLFGPASQFYGSDAIGGVLCFATKEKPYSDSTEYGGNVSLRFSSASREGTWHVDYGISSSRFSSFTSLSFSNFGDLRMGTNGPSEYQRNEYNTYTPNRGDSVVQNPNPNVQLYSGYSQLNAMQKFRYKLSDNEELKYGLYWSTTSNTPRYDRLMLKENGSLVNGDWFYGPQKWLMNRLSYITKKETSISDVIQVTLAHQLFEESRNDRKLFSDKLRVRTENVGALSANLDIRKRISKIAKISYGAEIIYNKVTSVGEQMDIISGAFTPTSSRYPDGSTWDSEGLYFNLLNKWNENHTTEGGLRYNRVHTEGIFDTAYFPLPVTSFENRNQALTGSVSHVIKLDQGKIGFIASTAFKSPNIDDISKVFDSNPGFIIVPNTDLKPEYAYNGELNAEYLFDKRLRVSSSIFYTYLTNALTTSESTLKGNDSILYDGVMSKVQMLTNQDFATVYGAQISILLSITSTLSLKSAYTYLYSKAENNGQPIRHITPNFGGTNLTYKNAKATIVLSSNYNQEFAYKQFTLNEQQNAFLYAKNKKGLPYSPAWFVLNIRGSFPITDKIQATVAIDNLLDKRYRPYSSGITAPGRNLIFSLKAKI